MKRSSWRFLWKSEDIRNKLLISLLLLAVYRLAANIPVPGVDRATVAQLAQLSGTGTNLIGLLDLLSGGSVSRFSILAMGVYPYITAQIILQLLQPVIPSLERMMKEDPRQGRIWMEKWTVILTIPMALLSAFGQINIFNQMLGSSVITSWGFTADKLLPTMTAIISMVGGTMFGIWIGELISEYGLRNQGLSLIIFSGIVSRLPQGLISMLNQKEPWWVFALVLVVLTLTIFAIVFVQQGRRNVPVMFPGRRIGTRMSMPVRSNLPLMVNMAGMIPLIFAQTFLSFPALLASYFIKGRTEGFWYGMYEMFSGAGDWGWIYPVLYFVLVVAFTFFYTDVLFTQQNYGDSLKKQGAQIPGVVRGGPTQKYLTKVQRRITFPGAFFLGFVAVLPYLLSAILPLSQSTLFVISAAGLLIVVGVVRDTFTIIETELKVHGYDESIIKG